MAAVATLSRVDIQKVVDTGAATGGPTDDEKAKFTSDALGELRKDDQVKIFEDNVKQVGVWANQVDAAFDNVTRGFESMNTKYGQQFPEISAYLNEWKGYKGSWVQYLANSRNVASTHITILRRFDQVFLNMVENIKTDQDRVAVIGELQKFIDEKHDDSTQMSQDFLNLKRDIEAFVGRFDQWIVDKGVQLEAQANQLIQDINGLQGEISALDKKINDATIALSAMGMSLNIFGLIVAGSVLASYKSDRNSKAADLAKKKKDLADVNQKQTDLANLKTEFNGLKPDIMLICEKLVLFAEIWSSVQSQTIQFQEHLKGGTGSETNIRFRMEVQLARAVCSPLVNGLAQYSTVLENRTTNASG
ncbi:uncharacterized protein FIBRA_02842 [Fibroporia radiculosa]|uniref:Uncharacterized protein n=1 Tax=Fibroporia radiculosa TaxID=599839 RepID=J4GN55_9APHY|nr:uncharacterized protein FIBRA_02842 [Fibroporia radiculosa]CCM00800.1 predicted protein [Fibroporia radiculosa]